MSDIKDAAEHKLKQLGEALSMLEKMGSQLDWALDFSEFDTIERELQPVNDAIYEAYENLEQELERLQEAVVAYENDKAITDADFDEESELKHYID